MFHGRSAEAWKTGARGSGAPVLGAGKGHGKGKEENNDGDENQRDHESRLLGHEG